MFTNAIKQNIIENVLTHIHTVTRCRLAYDTIKFAKIQPSEQSVIFTYINFKITVESSEFKEMEKKLPRMLIS